MAAQESLKELLDNKYVLFGLVGVALILGQLVKRWVIRLKNKDQGPVDPRN